LARKLQEEEEQDLVASAAPKSYYGNQQHKPGYWGGNSGGWGTNPYNAHSPNSPNTPHTKPIMVKPPSLSELMKEPSQTDKDAEKEAIVCLVCHQVKHPF
jgi:hypothetical protein